MILDKLADAALYTKLHRRFAAAFHFLEHPDAGKLAIGRHAIEGEHLFALVQTNQTKSRDECKWEAHRRYIDIQYVVEGGEQMGYANLNELREAKAYDPKDDYLLLDGHGSFFEVKPGMFTIFMPQDAHMPGVALISPAQCRKIVVKVEVA